jgi:Ca-activated chloride channel family protein
MKTVFTLFAVLAGCLPLIHAQTSLYGRVIDDTGEPVILAGVTLHQNGVFRFGTETDFDGHYHFSNIDPGTYRIEVRYVGFETKAIEGVPVLAGKANKLDLEMKTSSVTLDEVVVVDYRVPLIEQDNTTSGSTITMGGRHNYSRGQARRSPKKGKKKHKKKTEGSALPSEQINKLPTRNINSMASSTAGIKSTNEANNVAIRSSRSNETVYYVDGVRVSGHLSPEEEAFTTGQTTSTGAPKQKEGQSPVIENPFIAVQEEAFSTFSIDVDHAAYSHIRQYIDNKQLPPADIVRTEELINYFHYDYPAPDSAHPFSLHTELGPCPWQEGHQLLHIGLKGKELNLTEAPPANLAFLIDVSGSMADHNKLPLLKEAFALLVEQLRPEDQIAIVSYSNDIKVVLEPCSGSQKQKILSKINSLRPAGGTAGGPGLQKAYELLQQYYLPEGSNRVIIATDGDFNIGIADKEELEKFITEKRKTGIELSVLGFGMRNYQDGRLEMLANKGNGNYAYIDHIEEAEKLFFTELTGTLFTIAKDVKLQLEFDPETVASYRLIGYENRLLEKEDFENDSRDAGELGAGHTVTALYQIVLKDQAAPSLGDIHLRYKQGNEEQSYYLAHPILNEDKEAGKSENFKLSAAVAAYALTLKNSVYKGSSSYEMAIQLAQQASQDDLEGFRKDFVQMIEKTAKIDDGVKGVAAKK